MSPIQLELLVHWLISTYLRLQSDKGGENMSKAHSIGNSTAYHNGTKESVKFL